MQLTGGQLTGDWIINSERTVNLMYKHSFFYVNIWIVIIVHTVNHEI